MKYKQKEYRLLRRLRNHHETSHMIFSGNMGAIVDYPIKFNINVDYPIRKIIKNSMFNYHTAIAFEDKEMLVNKIPALKR